MHFEIAYEMVEVLRFHFQTNTSVGAAELIYNKKIMTELFN